MDISFDQLVNFGNLVSAWQRFRMGKSRRPDVMAFEQHLEHNLFDLLAELERGTYGHGLYETFELKDSKRRRIDKATVRDRVVHELLFRHLESVFDRRFITDSFSSRKGKGTLCALARADAFLAPWRHGATGWTAVIGDVESFFATVPHTRLLSLLGRQISDARVLALLEVVIRSFHSRVGWDRGIPLGNVTSQIFANVVLHELDHEVKYVLRLPRYLRYNDDVLAVVATQEEAHRVVECFQRKAQKLGFVMKTSLVALSASAQFDWLGATYFQGGRSVRLDTRERVHHAHRVGAQRLMRRRITENTYRRMLLSYRVHRTNYVQKN